MKNLSVTVTDKHFAVNKLQIHKLVNFIKNYLSLKVDYLEINLVSSSEILEINTEHLNHNYTTDIITFNYGGS